MQCTIINLKLKNLIHFSYDIHSEEKNRLNSYCMHYTVQKCN